MYKFLECNLNLFPFTNFIFSFYFHRLEVEFKLTI